MSIETNLYPVNTINFITTYYQSDSLFQRHVMSRVLVIDLFLRIAFQALKESSQMIGFTLFACTFTATKLVLAPVHPTIQRKEVSLDPIDTHLKRTFTYIKALRKFPQMVLNPAIASHMTHKQVFPGITLHYMMTPQAAVLGTLILVATGVALQHLRSGHDTETVPFKPVFSRLPRLLLSSIQTQTSGDPYLTGKSADQPPPSPSPETPLQTRVIPFNTHKKMGATKVAPRINSPLLIAAPTLAPPKLSHNLLQEGDTCPDSDFEWLLPVIYTELLVGGVLGVTRRTGRSWKEKKPAVKGEGSDSVIVEKKTQLGSNHQNTGKPGKTTGGGTLKTDNKTRTPPQRSQSQPTLVCIAKAQNPKGAYRLMVYQDGENTWIDVQYPSTNRHTSKNLNRCRSEFIEGGGGSE